MQKRVNLVDIAKNFQMSIYYSLATFGFDTAENEPAKKLQNCSLFVAKVRKLLAGSFSAVSKRNFASKYALVTRCYAKQYEVVLRCMSPCSVCTEDFFQLKMLRISSH